MNEKILEQLDYCRIKKEISHYAVSAEGTDFILSCEPLVDSVKIEKRKNCAKEWTFLLTSDSKIRLKPWDQICEALKILVVEGGCLSKEEIFALLQFCLSVNFLIESFNLKNSNSQKDYTKICPNLAAEIQSMYDLSKIADEISKIIDINGNFREIPEIREINRAIKKKRDEIENVIKGFVASKEYSDFLQSKVPVLRNGRQVLAVKSGNKKCIKGIVHEVSHTGATLYIEPEQVVSLSNELIEEEARLVRQIKIIFTELTAKIANFKDELLHNLFVMTNLDFAYASARWGIEKRCCFAKTCDFSCRENITLIHARHPILEEKAVPIDIIFTPQVRILIITGVNTGGKTVTLKTVALFALLNQSGFPILADENSSLPIFSKVFADIGDEQSLDENLSTFSGHMKNIASMLKEADQDSLVLLDELGSGTDSQEGGAIAMAVLDELIDRGCFVILTTHHGVIKNFGYTGKNCLNASVEFDNQTLSPTYKILMGVPGSSHAVEIAQRSGIPENVIKKANSYIDTNQADIATLIGCLTEKYAEVSRIEKEIKEKEDKIKEKWRKVDLANLQVKQHELELREQGYRQSQNFVEESRKILENLVRELKETQSSENRIGRQQTLKVKQVLDDFNEAVEREKSEIKDVAKEIQRQKNQKKDCLKQENEFAVGECVKIGSKKADGIILECKKNGKYLVQAGSIKLTLNGSQMYKTGNTTENKVVHVEAVLEKPVFELRILGMHSEQAIKILEHQLDLCSVNDFKHFSIIHGKGEGILQKAVWNYLKKSSIVESFNFAPYEEGGSGKTYVNLY
ncbi:MAG: endonuclease MutS2 [Treponemataceae bacterium]